MNWDAVGAIAEVGGVIGIIVSLLYLSLQIRHGALSERAEMQHAILSEFRTLVSHLYLDKEMTIAHQCVQSGQEIPNLTKVSYLLWVGNLFRVYEELSELSENNLISSEFWDSRRSYMRDLYLAHPEVRKWWQTANIGFFTSTFRKLGDGLIKELELGA